MMTIYRVTWTDTSTGEAHGVNVHSIKSAQVMAQSLTRAKDTDQIVVSIFNPQHFSVEHYIAFPKPR